MLHNHIRDTRELVPYFHRMIYTCISNAAISLITNELIGGAFALRSGLSAID
jgi:hypothetical protein